MVDVDDLSLQSATNEDEQQALKDLPTIFPSRNWERFPTTCDATSLAPQGEERDVGPTPLPADRGRALRHQKGEHYTCLKGHERRSPRRTDGLRRK